MVFEKTVLNKLLANAFDRPVKVTYWDGKIEEYGVEAGHSAEIYLNFNKKIALSELTAAPTLVLAEAYMNEDIEITGDSPQVIQKLIASSYRKMGSFLTDQSGLTGTIAKRVIDGHNQRDSRSDIHRHYDIGNDFYKMWLDETMTYSCAYFAQETMSLKEAQIAKNHHILNKLHTRPQGRILDIGCGWGSLIITAAQEYGLTGIGVTLSNEQFYLARKRVETLGLQDKIKIYLKDYRDIEERDFDYVVSVGMFEHVGKENLGLYFEKVSDFLKMGGRALIHGITGQHRGRGFDPFIEKYIFPGGYIPNIGEQIEHILDAKLQLDDLESLRRHYQRTLECWTENYHKVFEQIAKAKGRSFARMWDLYLQACAASFETGNVDVMQFLLTKGLSGEGLPMTRDYMYDV